MTITVSNYEVEASDQVRSRPKWPIYSIAFAGVTASAGIIGEVYEFPSLSMTPQDPQHAQVYYRSCKQEPEYGDELLIKFLLLDPWKRPETDVEEGGGVYAPPRRRQILFSQEVTLRVADLPQRRPYISPVMLVSEEDGAGRD